MKSRILPITSSAAMAEEGEFAGKFVPIVMVDIRDHPDVQEVIRVHGHLDSGDCGIEWGVRVGGHGESTVLLHLEFLRPIALRIAVAFDLDPFAPIVDNILHAGAMYLQHGLSGDSYLSTQDAPRLLIEIPDVGFARHWEWMYRRAVVKVMRANGAPPKVAKTAAPEYIGKVRSLLWTQMPPVADR
ncbi:hypothetical protein [Microbacterium phyllosphaerae]|uniref:hypothetical protein n=1 Tax=Microbacterium phyllosphaerae TaxID=124798 RepID=UPI00216929A6|nr:hypothetical protein [Microbacterium phyllosphaerae]MCS3442203.1 hypothetical protein [Microbacterium phyllosphaerae]